MSGDHRGYRRWRYHRPMAERLRGCVGPLVPLLTFAAGFVLGWLVRGVLAN